MSATAKRLRNAIVLASVCIGLGSARPTAARKPATAPRIAVNCDHERPQIAVRSSVDNKLYRIDVYAVADSASGEDFRSEIH
jgi:hypothetical protein